MKDNVMESSSSNGLRNAQADRDRNRLQFLLKQAEIFQHFAPASAEKKKWVETPVNPGGSHGPYIGNSDSVDLSGSGALTCFR